MSEKQDIVDSYKVTVENDLLLTKECILFVAVAGALGTLSLKLIL